jgi:hypothetical protein
MSDGMIADQRVHGRGADDFEHLTDVLVTRTNMARLKRVGHVRGEPSWAEW